MIKCPKCKFPVADENEFCPYCKWKLTEPYQETSEQTGDPVQTAGAAEKREAEEAARREAEERERLAQEEQARKARETEAAKAELRQKLNSAEALANARNKVTKRWTILLVIFLIVTAVGFFGRNANQKTSYSKEIPVEEFQPWSKDSKEGDGVTFKFTSLGDLYIHTRTTTFGSSQSTVSSLGSGITTYEGFYLVSDESGQTVVLYANISGEDELNRKLTGFFPEMQTVTIGTDEFTYLPEGVSPTAVGTYHSSLFAMGLTSQDDSSKQIQKMLSAYPFIDLDDTTVYREVPIEGAQQRKYIFEGVLVLGIVLSLVMYFLRKASAAKGNALSRNVNQVKSEIQRLSRL